MNSFKSALLTSIAGIALTATAAAQAEQTVIDLHETHGGQFAVATIVEGQGPMDFLVDTGANRTAVLTPLAVKLGMLSQEEHEAILYGMTGSVQTRLLDIQHIDFGNGNVGPLETALVPLGPDTYLTAYGLLGADAFADEIIEIDLDAEQLRIGVAPPDPNVRRHLFHIDEEGLLRATVRVSGVQATAIIDTGSTRTIANSALVNAVGASRPAMFVDLGGVTASRGDQAGTVLVESIRMGSVCRRAFRVLRSDLDIFNTLGIGDEPAMIIGLDYLNDTSITVDRQRDVFTVAGGGGTCRGRSSSLRD